MSKKIYIHIGSHKTGTTSIQHSLFNYPLLLKKHNFTYFSKQPNGNEYIHPNLNSWIYEKSNLLVDGYQIYKPEILSLELSKISNNVIISGEYFSYIFMEEELAGFKKSLLKYFDEIEIIVYLRRQDQQVISHYNQASKFFNSPASIFYGNKVSAIPEYKEHFGYYLNYYKKLSIWANVFGKKNITIRIFDKKELLNGDAVSDFFHLLGIDDSIDHVMANESSGFEKAKMGFLMSQANISSRPLRNAINRNLDSDTKLLPKREDAQRFYEQYRESNIALNKVFNISDKNEAIFNDDFSIYPEEGSELWTEEGVNETMITIFKSLNETYGTINYNVLFQAAVKLEKSDFKLSYEMMKILLQFIPDDPNVQQQMNRYNVFLKSTKKEI